MLQKLRVLTLVAITVTWLATPAQATPLLGNLANPVGGGFGGAPDSGDEFLTGGAALTITDIDVLWETGFGGTANRVGLFTDAAGLPSGTQVGTWFTSGLATTSGALINYVGSANLAANTTYHVVLDILDRSRAAFTFSTAFNLSDPATLGAANPLGSSFGDIQAVSWSEDPANLMWQLNGTAVAAPEPASMVLLTTGLVGFVLSRRRIH